MPERWKNILQLFWRLGYGGGGLIEVGLGIGVGIKLMPTVVAPEGFEAHEGFITGGGPELAGAFEAALVLTAGRLNSAGT
jgi:hypothetical protein